MDGEAVDVYGSGLFTPDSLWDVPGYTNNPASAGRSAITVYLAVADQPVKIFNFSPVYDVYSTLALARGLYTADLVVLGAGLVFLILAILWRKPRREARASLARGTGRLWFEVKVLAVVLVPAAVLWSLQYGWWGHAARLAAAAATLALYPWLLYLTANDLRHNEKPWRNSLCAKLFGWLLRSFRWAGSPAVAEFTARIWFEAKLLAVVGVPFITFLFWGAGYRFGSFANTIIAIASPLLCLAYPWLLCLFINDVRRNGKPWRDSLCLRLFGWLRRAFAWAGTPSAAELTARLWFEVKLLAALLPPYAAFFLWRYGYFLYFEQLIAAAIGGLLYLWLLRLFFNDLRRNKNGWRGGLCARLLRVISAPILRCRDFLRSEILKQPLQRRIAMRVIVLFALLVLFAAVLELIALYYLWDYGGMSRLVAVGLLMLLAVGLVALALNQVENELKFAGELSDLTGQLAAIRSGALAAPLALPEGSDLTQAAEDLNGIQQGMRSALEERMKSERMKVELIANVSHDLKTPLTSVISYAELLREEEDLPPHVRDYIRILNDKAQHLRVMVQDVFEVSKAASGELSVRTERLDLSKLLRQTLADMDEPIEQSTLAFRASLPAEPVWIDADGDRLYRIFQNLIQNALQYALEGSRVYVTLSVQGASAVAAVKNTSRDELPPGTDFTARFVRGDSSRSSGGGGLGLAIASSYAAACGGALRVETDADLFAVQVSFPMANRSDQ